ncbi:MAG: GNAT family protein [Dehalococcoidia bacterium]|nr:GNAT family protein [Dehalococcoidia bacterium]
MKGERVRLRPITWDDLGNIANWRNKAFDSFFGDEYLTAVGQIAWFERYKADPTQRLFIVETEGSPIGCIGLANIDRHHQSADLGRTLIGIDYERRNGYALEAVQILIDYAFKEMNLHRLSLEVFSHNEEAWHLYTAAGFVQEGILREAIWKGGQWRDVMIMGILRECVCRP